MISELLVRTGLEDLQLEAVPESLRGLARLEELNLSGWSLLHSLPDWLGQLPLRKLLANNCYSLESDALPTSFASLGQHRRLHASLPAGLRLTLKVSAVLQAPCARSTCSLRGTSWAAASASTSPVQ